jgi:predicted nucleic acid-binding protein
MMGDRGRGTGDGRGPEQVFLMRAIDSLIAASAGQRGFALVTRNASDFVHTGISLFNPWDFDG